MVCLCLSRSIPARVKRVDPDSQHSTMALQLAAQMKSSHIMGRFESKPWKIVNSESVDLA